MRYIKNQINYAKLEDTDIKSLLEEIYSHYGWDFRDYALSSIKRRIAAFLQKEKIETISALKEMVLSMDDCMQRLLLSLSVEVTSMFRDPSFYFILRQRVVPVLATYPFIRIWNAGCSTGEEAYSMAVLLEEEGLYEKSRIYATDMNEVLLNKAEKGIFPLNKLQEYTQNYIASGGKNDFSKYYTAKYNHAILSAGLAKNITWAQHNLVSDNSFNEFNLILCRNVLIYFNPSLYNRVHKLLYDSLGTFGFLCLGDKETLKFTPYEDCYEGIDPKEKIYKKSVYRIADRK